MEDKTLQQSEALALICPTCGARYTLPKYVEGQKYGCKRCSASLMFGKFALQQELGRGGFGVVYKAFQADLQRVVALKFHTDSAESTERFMREARIAANLSHPNITAIFEVGQHDGKPYITMQFVDGITTNKADFSIREAVFVMRGRDGIAPDPFALPDPDAVGHLIQHQFTPLGMCAPAQSCWAGEFLVIE